MRDFSVNTNSSRPPGNTSLVPVESRHRAPGLQDAFERSLKAVDNQSVDEHDAKGAGEHQLSDPSVQQEDGNRADGATYDSLYFDNYAALADTLWSRDLPTVLRDHNAGELTVRDSIQVAQTTQTQGVSVGSYGGQMQNAFDCVAKILAQMDQMHGVKATQRWQFDWISGGVLKMSLRISRGTDGEFGISISNCESDYCRQEFVEELNRRLTEKQYDVNMVDENG